MEKMQVKELRKIVKKGLDMTVNEIKQLAPNDVQELIQATTELLTRKIKATEKEEYADFLDTLKEYAPLIKIEKVANEKIQLNKDNKKAPKKDNKKAEKKEEKKEANILEKIKIGDVVKFRVEEEEIEHNIKIIYISRYDVIAITENEREVFKIRKIDFKNQVFEWKDRKGETYNIIVTL